MANLLEEAKNRLQGKLCKVNGELTLYATPSQWYPDGNHSAKRLTGDKETFLVLDIIPVTSLKEGREMLVVKFLTNNEILYTSRFPFNVDNSILFGCLELV
jgi:hypothetical protein